MKIVKAYNWDTKTFQEWSVPSREALIAKSEVTWAKYYDRIEGEVVEGGLPTVLLKHKEI